MSDEFNTLSDADLRSMAEDLWSKGEEDSALMMLDYLIDQNMGDKQASVQLRNEYLVKLQNEKTPVGRMKAAGWGFLTGEVKSWESLAGSSVGDLVVYGDLRDIVRETAFEDKTDEFVVVMSALGLATTIYPPADPAVSIIKASKKAGVISTPLSKQITKIGKTIIESSSDGAKIEKVKDGLLPFYELSKHTRTWSEYATILKHADSIDQIKVLTKMASQKPGNSKKLAQILLLAGKSGVENAKRYIDIMMNHGQKGMDVLYGALRKGPRGLKFVAEHPTLIARGLKNAEKTRSWWTHEFSDMVRKWGAWIQPVRLGIIGLIVSILFYSATPRKWREKLVGRIEMNGKTSATASTWLNQLIPALMIGALIALLIGAYESVSGPAQFSASSGLTESVSGSGLSNGSSGNNSMLLGITMLMATLFLQGTIWFVAKKKLEAIAGTLESAASKLKRIENLDIFFDLPLYAGLALTIFAFILITIDAGMSRIMAYSSTVIGILSAVSLRVIYLYPIREKLLDAVNSENR